ncbi:hypothetical protein Dimus_038915 [Dionaea muscipula]
MARMAVDESRSLGYGALLTHIFIAMGVDLSHSMSIPTKGPITSYTVQRSNVADRMAQAPQRDDPSILTREHSGRSSRRPSASTSAPSSSAPPVPPPSPYARLPPEFQDALTSLQTTLSDQITRQFGELQTHFDSRLDAQFGTGSFAHFGVGSYAQFGATPFGTSQFAATTFGTPQFGTSQFGASQFSGGGFSQFGAGSSFVPPAAPVAPPPVFPPRIIEDYDDNDDEDDD